MSRYDSSPRLAARRPDGRDEGEKERGLAPLLGFPFLLSSAEDETRAVGERKKNLVMGSEADR